MTNRTFGRLLAFFSMAAFVGITELIFHPFRGKPPAPPPPPHVPVYGENAAGCTALAEQYHRTWETLGTCTEDDQCVVEAQSPGWSGTDECYRISSKGSREDAAAASLAKQWHALGCLDPQLKAHQSCPMVPSVHCRHTHCVERAGGTLPANWKRATIPNMARLYLPPDFTYPVTKQVAFPTTKEIEGTGRTLIAQVVSRKTGSPALSPTTVLAATMAGGKGKIVSQPTATVDGYPTTLFVLEGQPAPPPGAPPDKTRHFYARTELGGITSPNAPPDTETFFILSMSCETREQCDALIVVAEHAELLVTNNAARPDGGAK
jgi:hypothetical protein